jgi:hypothetical protein
MRPSNTLDFANELKNLGMDSFCRQKSVTPESQNFLRRLNSVRDCEETETLVYSSYNDLINSNFERFGDNLIKFMKHRPDFSFILNLPDRQCRSITKAIIVFVII